MVYLNVCVTLLPVLIDYLDMLQPTGVVKQNCVSDKKTKQNKTVFDLI